MSKNDEEGGSNDPLPNDGNETNFGNLPNNVLHLIFREALDRGNIVPELLDINQEIQRLQERRENLMILRNDFQRYMDQADPKSVIDLEQSIRMADGTWFDINANQNLFRGSTQIRDDYQRQIDEIDREIERGSNLSSLLRSQFLFYMMLLRRHRY